MTTVSSTCAYHGKAAAAGATVSSVAKTLGWSETVWDLSGTLPVLKQYSGYIFIGELSVDGSPMISVNANYEIISIW